MDRDQVRALVQKFYSRAELAYLTEFHLIKQKVVPFNGEYLRLKVTAEQGGVEVIYKENVEQEGGRVVRHLFTRSEILTPV